MSQPQPKPPVKKKTGRPPKVTDEVTAKARRLVAAGLTIREAAEILSVTKSPLAAALARERAPLASAGSGSGAAPTIEIDAKGDPLSILRELLKEQTDRLATLPADSPRLNQLRTAATRTTMAIAALERDRAKQETPEEAERRRRREDREVLREMEQHIVAAEREAARRGVCLHCGQPLPLPEAR